MGLLSKITEAMGVKALTSMFYTGYNQVSPGYTRVEAIPFALQMNTRYTTSVTDVLANSDPRTNALANMLATIYTCLLYTSPSPRDRG